MNDHTSDEVCGAILDALRDESWEEAAALIRYLRVIDPEAWGVVMRALKA